MLNFKKEDNDIVIKEYKGSCIAMICPNDRRFKGKSFDRYLTELNSINFDKVILLLAGGNLEKRSLGVKFTTEDLPNAIKEAKSREISWKEKEVPKIAKYKKFSFAEWDDFIEGNVRYKELREEVSSIYFEDKDFKRDIDLSVKYFLKRHFVDKDFDKSSPEFLTCLDYKLTETAGLLLKKELDFRFLAYPGNLCPGLNYFLNNIINNKEANLSFIQINLKRKEPNKSPQISTSVKVGIFKPSGQPPVLAMLDVELRSCKSPQEALMLLAQINSLTSKYMTQYAFNISSKESLDTEKKLDYQKDGGVNFI